MKQQVNESALRKAALAVIMWLLVFQNLLQRIWHPFYHIEEIVGLFGACLGIYDIIVIRKGRPSKDQLWIGVPLLMFIAVGLAGNLIYQYQPLKCVIIDLYTNLKFFFAIGTGYYLFASLEWEEIKKTAQWNARVITLLLFALFLVDRLFGIWPGQVRFGIPSTLLFFEHFIFLSAVMAFLLALMTVFYDKKNIPYIIMALTIMAFTLRTKSLISTAVYVAMFFFFLVFQWKLRIWHILTAFLGCIALGWNSIRFYFVDLSGHSARSVILQKSFAVMRDYFPIGTGFGTFGSEMATRYFSPVHIKYNFNDYFELRDPSDIENTLQLIKRDKWLLEEYQKNPEKTIQMGHFIGDQFWPTIFGQAGFMGTAALLVALGALLKRCLDVRKYNLYAYVGVLFVIIYLILSSTAEKAFHNPTAVPLALVLGIVFAKMDAQRSVQ